MQNMNRGLALRAFSVACGLGLSIGLAGCATSRGGESDSGVRPAQVRALDYGSHTDPIDRDRIALRRFIGAWDFTGSYTPPGESRRTASGIASGTIEQGYFLLLDTARIVDQKSDVEFITGAMLLSAEPGLGLMVTEWSEDSPAVHRFPGRVFNEGTRFVFDGVRSARATGPLRMVMQFETDDRWVLEFSRTSGEADEILASYTFTRAN